MNYYSELVGLELQRDRLVNALEEVLFALGIEGREATKAIEAMQYGKTWTNTSTETYSH